MEKRFRINPKYQLGDTMRKNLRKENLRRSYGMNIPYSQALPYTNQDITRQSNTGVADEFYPTVGEDGRIISSDNNEESIFSPALHFLFGDYEHAKERWDAASVGDAYRLWQEKRLQAEMTKRLNRVNEAKLNLSQLDDAEAYASLIDNRFSLQEEYKKAISEGDLEKAIKILNAYSENEKNILDFLNKIKTEGKKSDVNIELFFDPNAAKSKEYLKAFAENFGPDPNIKGSWYNPIAGIQSGLSMLGNIAASAQQGIDAIGTSIKGLYENIKGDKNVNFTNGNYIRRAIKQSLADDRWTDHLFVAYDKDSLNGNGGDTNMLRNKIKSMRNYWDREYNERMEAEKETANKYKNGTWYFDPQKINPKFRYYSEHNDAGVVGGLLPDQLLYSFAETGSSYSDFENMAAMMATDAASGILAKKIATFAIKRSPYVLALTVLDDYNKMRAAGRMEEAAKMASLLRNALKVIQSTQTAVKSQDLAFKLGANAANLFFINRMREHETNSEVIDAWSSRILTNSMNKNADMNKVLNTTRNYLDNMGIDTKNMTDIDLVQHALAYNIDTKDKIFEEEKEAGRVGLKKVYNDNMALAAKDYAEVIPFLGYSGSFLRSFGKGTVNKFAEQTYQSQARTLFDRTFTKLASSGLNNIGNKLAAKHSLEFLGRFARNMGYIGSLEAIEEGQQELLQSRYGRGLYDQYNQNMSTFPLASILEDVHLATDAVAAYMGVLSGDPDNGSHQIKRAMQIGGITGMLMGGGALQTLSNVFPSEGRDNIRNLLAQIKNDKVMDILVGDHYGVAQDDQHLGIFYDSLQKHRVSVNRLRNAIEDLKLFKGGQVTDDFINRDIELLNNIYYVLEHPLFQLMLQDKDIKVGTDRHKQAVITTARLLTQFRDAAKYIEYDNSELDQKKNTIYRKILNAAEGGLSEAADVETDLLVLIIYDNYQKYLNQRKDSRKKLEDTYTSLLKNENAQDWQLHKAKEDLENFDKLKQYSYLEYVEQALNHLYSTRFVINSEDLLERLQDRTSLLNEISKELGIDVSTSRLRSMIDSIEKTKKEMLSLFDKDGMTDMMNEAIQQLNKKAKKGQKKIPLIKNIAHRLEQQYGKLPQQEEFDNIQRRMILNRAVYDSIEPIANAFLRGKIDPRLAFNSISYLNWKQLSNEEKNLFLKKINEQRTKEGKKPLTIKGAVFEYNKILEEKKNPLRKLAEQYKEHLHKHTDMDNTVSSIDVDAESMQKEAASLLFDYEMQYREELRRVNHREYLRNSASNTELSDAVDNNDEDAIDVRNQDFDTVTLQLDDQNNDIEQPTIPDDNINQLPEEEVLIDDIPEDESPIARMSDNEIALRRDLGMLDEDEYEEDYTNTDDDVSSENENDNISVEEYNSINLLDDIPEDEKRDTDVIEKNERFISTPNQIYNDFLGLTFKYDPTNDDIPNWIAGIKEKDGTITPIKFKNNGVLRSPSELAKKLLIPGWFDKADKYFVITADKTSVVDLKNPDNLVVALILQDGKDVYATFLTGLAMRNKGYTKNEEKDIRFKMDAMFWSSFNYNGNIYIVKDKETGKINVENLELGRYIARRNAYLQQNMNVDPTSLKNDEEGRKIVNKWYSELDTEEKNRVDLLTRKFLSGGRSVHSNEHIDAQIANLRNTRNQIINALLDKDSEGNYILKSDPTEYKSAKPVNPHMSDGKINDQIKDGEYVFRNMLEGGFGMATDLEELTRQIEDEEVRLGVGRGERAFDPFAIDKLNQNAQGTYSDSGKGLAGKIYFIAETVSGKDRAIMLSERKFRDQAEHVDPNDIELAFNPDGTLKEGITPSMAEFILYLITNRISNDVFSGISIRNIPLIKSALIGNEENGGSGIIVNHGVSTWVVRKDEKRQPHFAAKQFFINEEKNTLVVALPDKSGTPRSVEFKIGNEADSIFYDETQRRIVIAAIANNLHWNTPWDIMNDNMPIGILEAASEYFENNPSATEYKIAGIDDLTFKKDDLFDSELNPKNVSLVAWLIGTGKLRTTVGDNIFYAPFVYCNGAEETNPAQNASKKVEQEVKNKEKTSKKRISSTKPVEKQPSLEAIQSRLSKFNSERVGKTLHITEKQESGEVSAYALFDIDAGTIEKPAEQEAITSQLKDSVNSFIKYVKDKHGIELNAEDIELPDVSEYDSVSSGQALFTASLLPDGTVVVMVEKVDDILNLVQEDGYTVQGVFAEENTEGTLDANKARAWIKDTLGLDDAQVIVTNAILKSVLNQTVYGVMTVMNNVLTDVIGGTFILPKYGGSTVHYHEAFHYVNLLLHSRRKRQQIYEEYIKRHPEYKDFSKRRIEELLANDFVEYCKALDNYEDSLRNKNIFSRWAIKLFNRFIEFIRLFGKRDLIKDLFKSISKGRYKNQLIDQESLLDFLKAYGGEVYKKFSAEGPTDELIDNFKAISTYQQFYSVAENAAHGFIDFLNIKKAENVSLINQEMFDKYIEKIRINNIRKKNPFVQDIIDNPAAFINTINALLKQYGIVGKNKKKNVENTSTGEGQLNEQRRPDESIQQLSLLYDNYIIDQKANVAYRAKLFLTQIRDVRFKYNEELKQNEVVQKVDPETGLPLYVSFDDAWSIITKELNEVDSFEELMSEVLRLAKTKAFFAELYKNLASINNDILLQTQIYSTVNKHLTKVVLVQIETERLKKSRSNYDLDGLSESEIVVPTKQTVKYDQEKVMNIINDNALKAKRMLPRDWSADFFSSAAIKYDEFYHIDKDYMTNVVKKNFDEIKSILEKARKEDINAKEKAFNEVFPMIIKLLNDMSIPFDDDVLTEYIMMHVKSAKTSRRAKRNDDGVDMMQLFLAVDEIMQDPKANKEKSANISFFVNVVFNSTVTPQVKISSSKVRKLGLEIKGYSKPRPLDEIYIGFGGEIEKMAIAYNNIHPSSRELSITGPGNTLIYPIGENNYMSDITRWINKNYNKFVDNLSKTTYAQGSRILDAARIIIRSNRQGDLVFKLNVFVGMEDSDLKKGVDYFGINSIEDVISKMLLSNNNMIVLPIMADKKTYYVLELVSRRNDDTSDIFSMPHDLLIERESPMFPGKKALRFSDETLDIFAQYFLDELHSLEQYYDKDNVKAVVNNKNIRKKNFHGKVKNGRMDFSGNGGKFRYFYGLDFTGLPGEDLGGINLNQLLEYEYLNQKEAENPIYGGGVWEYRTDSEDIDGFEGVRTRLQQIRDHFVNTRNGKDSAKTVLYDAINKMLIDRVYDDIENFSKPGVTLIIKKVTYKDPTDQNAVEELYLSNRAIPNQLVSEYAERFKKIGIDPVTGNTLDINSASAYSRNDKSSALVLSVIGNYTVLLMISIIEIEKVYSGDPALYKWIYDRKPERRIINESGVDLQILKDKDSDKIKRLGAVLSPGAELRTDFSKEEVDKFPWISGTKYINATIKDVELKSLYIEEVKDIFTRQLVADQLRKIGADKERIDKVYVDNEAYKKEFDWLSDEVKNTIKTLAEEQSNPYTNINVTDAQVLIRPDMYRKIRMMLGTWSVIPQKIKYTTYTGQVLTTTYSDNEAFEILENDPEWMLDTEKAAKVSKLQLYPLKMSYFKNDPRSFRGSSYNVAYPVYNKMAIFPAFKYIMRSETGKKIYDRMNNSELGVLDMISVESAVKVGMAQDAYKAYEGGSESLSRINESINNKSACILENDKEQWDDSNNTLNVEVQDVRGLRMQLNTEAHLDEERNIGTQMFKILFGNIYDDEFYTGGDPNAQKRSGKDIRREIMDCINALTELGINQLKNKFYNAEGTIDSKKVHKYFKQIAENNGLPTTVIELLDTTALVESTMQRVLFEHSVSSLVNSYVIDIPTKGGSAVQQSVFGTVSYDSTLIRTKVEKVEGYPVPNDGRELNWNEKNGSMEIMLSMNFFKAVVPIEYQKTFAMMRNWLINHNIIKGFIKLEDGTFKPNEAMIFGVGYRIPTQGMSSTFAFTVADVLPEQAGDVIIVPREFTAQTGSDFDVDKIYLATMSFKNGKLEEIEGDLTSSTKGAISNRLLQNYITILTDIKNRSNARGAIDTVTNIIKDSTLPAIRQSNRTYRPSMYELSPYFQLRRKLEFSIGKSGIGPFALNITNLALTLFAHISIDYGENEFGFGKLDEIIGQDGIRISDWLSAMINAHVDVAKDPYVFDLNINSCTYNMTNFLLRAGKGESTFLFLAQPALKEYADEFNNYGGLYGTNLKYDDKKESKYKLLDVKIKKYKDLLQHAINNILNEETRKIWQNTINNIMSNEYDNWSIVFDPNYSKEALKSPNSIKGLQFQLLSLIAFKKISPYAEEMSNLVKMSRIDTKKFGNTLALRRDFINEYKKFKNGERDVKWINTDDSTLNPLHKYFETTFLEKKLIASVSMMNDILRNDVVTASTEFDNIVNTIFGEIYGFTEIIDEFNNKIHPYETVFDKKSVQNISDELENTFRHMMLFNYGPKVYDRITGIDSTSDSYNYYESLKERGYSGVIDFTFGGDEEILLSELNRIWKGNPYSANPYEKNSIFNNIANLIKVLERSSMEDRLGKFKGLVDENGRVINELLNYLRPQPANEKFDIPRLLLKKTNRNTATSEKSKLTSAFDFLLSHASENIRRIARDIAIYAYYSGYNTNSSYSFFDLIPVEYRKQYDMAIKDGVLNFSTVTLSEISAENGMQNYKEDCKPLIDVICRNFYSDDKIVPIFELPATVVKSILGESGTYIGRNIKHDKQTKGKTSVPTWFTTTLNNKPYVKVKIDGDTFLFRKIGHIVKKNITKNKEDQRKWYTYVLTEKLGIHKGNIHQYELFAKASSPSIFDLNHLPQTFSKLLVSSEIGNFILANLSHINKINSSLLKKKKDYTPDKISIEFVSYNNLAVEDSQMKSNLENDRNNSVIYTKNIEDYIKNHSDITIDINSIDQDAYKVESDINGTVGIFGELNINENSNEENKSHAVATRILDMLNRSQVSIESILLPNNEYGLQIKELYENGDYNFAENIYMVSQQSPEKTEVVSNNKKQKLLLPEDIVDGAKSMDEHLIVDDNAYKNDRLDIALSDLSNAPLKVMSITQELLEEMLRQRNKTLQETKKVEHVSSTPKFYSGKITPEENVIFVFGSNPQGRHGKGAAKVAKTLFGAIYGLGEGLQGNSYALPTKDLRIKYNRGLRSIPAEQIIENIKKMYEVARLNPTKRFMIAYTNLADEVSLNGYSGKEMADMFKKAGEIPSNVEFSENWKFAWNDDTYNIKC